MSCDINNNPCDECTEPYCPDQLEAVHNTHQELKGRVSYLTDELRKATHLLAAHKITHKDILNNNWRKLK